MSSRQRAATIYEATLPDGQVVRRVSTKVWQAEAYLACWKAPGEDWMAGRIWKNWAEVPEGQGFVTARRLD